MKVPPLRSWRARPLLLYRCSRTDLRPCTGLHCAARGFPSETEAESIVLKTLLILRHAKSSWDDSALDDHERPLNARGEKDAPRMGRLARKKGLSPELIISSDAVRARLTAEEMANATGGQILLDPRLYHASAAEILAVIRSVVEDSVATVMVVGHNPGLEELIARLTGEREPFPTAALAQIRLPIERWSAPDTAIRGALVGLWRPKELRR